ncbi:MAG: chemotaxis response regulator protein-glutamate methylesterase [Bryobacterales bacterium]|nr:chemotaxis response regulator protein-glutamate methylesterase [Bryobacterales bacterium]
MSKTRILIIDDSAIVRKLLAECLSGEKDMEVVGTAPDPFVARDKILALKPDVLTLDIEMPRMDGLTFLRKLMHYQPMPVVVISSLGQAGCQASLEALRLGAVEVLAKPGGPYSVGELRVDLAAKIRAAAAARVRRGTASPPTDPPPQPAPLPRPSPAGTNAVVAIGASTGGTEAIEAVLKQLPPDGLGIVITQHIPPMFSQAFANRLNSICPMEVREARDGDSVERGLALVAPGNFHMLLRKSPGGGFRVTVQDGPRVCYQRPSVDVMFCSVAEVAGSNAMGVLLTGMGADGAKGLLNMKHAGARTIAQDEASCVVFGMPKEAIRLGAAEQVAPLNRIPGAIAGFMSRAGR